MENQNQNQTIIIAVVIVVILLIALYFMTRKENFETDNTEVLLFLSKTCPHCVTFKNNQLPSLGPKLNEDGIKHRVMMADEDKEGFFDKHNIMYVPACVIIKNNKPKKLDGRITHEKIMETIKSMS